MANECIPYYAGAEMITVVAGTGGVNGKRFVTASGPLAVGSGIDGGVPTGIIPGAGAEVAGVASQDSAAGLAVGVFNKGVVPVTTSAALTAGTRVMTDASGFAAVWSGTNAVAGMCMADTASGSDAPIRLPA
jgi:predicted RecA/RadA family phage recombinase